MFIFCEKSNVYLYNSQEMKRLAGVDVDDDDDVIDNNKDHDVLEAADNLRVFCVSSADYLRLKGKVADAPTVGFFIYKGNNKEDCSGHCLLNSGLVCCVRLIFMRRLLCIA